MQDLTPQLRTRLGRVDARWGSSYSWRRFCWLPASATTFTTRRSGKGGWLPRWQYGTSLYSAAGLKVGDPVKLMGFDVGEITMIDTERPDGVYNVYVQFSVRAPYFGYLWTAGSKVRVSPTDFLGNRVVEVTKGTNYIPTHLVWEVREYTPEEALALADLKDKLFLDVFELPVVTRELLTPSFVAEDIGDFAASGGPPARPNEPASQHLLARFDEKNRDRVIATKARRVISVRCRRRWSRSSRGSIEGPLIYDAAAFGG